MYKSEILKSDKPWIISFVKKFKSMDHLVHSEELFQNLQILSDEYQGSVRFGIVDCSEEEFLKMTFEVFTVPQTFLIKEGMAYEMNTLAIFYDNVRRFIEGEYLNETKCYVSWPTPTYVIDKYTVYFHYAYNDGLKYYNKNTYEIFEVLRHYEVNEYQQVQDFFK